MTKWISVSFICSLSVFFSSTVRSESDTSLRIAIVGAGISGLTAAYTLDRLGYHNVTVFEADKRVGGKILSYEYEGQSYDLGGVIATEDYRTVFDIARNLGIQFKPEARKAVVVTPSGQSIELTDYPRYYAPTLQRLFALRAFNRVKRRYGAVFEPGFASASEDLAMNFSDFVALNRIDAIAEPLRPFIVGTGYGYYEEVPALYALKLLKTLVRTDVRHSIDEWFAVNRPLAWAVPGGFQSLWEAVASGLSVKVNCPVTRVSRRRSNDGQIRVDVTACEGRQNFDRIIVATPLDTALSFLDSTSDERNLFSRIQNYTYYSTLFTAAGLPNNSALFLAGHCHRTAINHVVALANARADSSVWIAYQLAETKADDAAIFQKLKDDVRDVGGTVMSLIVQKRWNYFPHVTSDDIRSGFYARLEGMQGLQGTFYVGSALSMETAEHVAEYSQSLVRANFH